MKQIEVIILECGTKCKTLNPLGKLEDYNMYCCHCDCGFGDIPVPCETYKHWKQAESARQVYEIEVVNYPGIKDKETGDIHYYSNINFLKPGTQHSAVIIDEQRKIVKIV